MVVLIAEKDELVGSNAEHSNKVLLLGKDLTSSCQLSTEKDAEIARLANVIRVIEGEKVANFEMGLALTPDPAVYREFSS